MNDVLEFVRPFITSIIGGLICGLVVSLQEKRSLGKREFLDRVNFSLNMIEGEWLRFRTLMERPGVEIFTNAEASKLVKKAAVKTTEQDCLLPIAEKDYWLCLNAALNEISEKFADGFLKRDMGCDSCRDIYVMCLTCEVAKEMKTRKVRVMLIKKSTLKNFPSGDLKVEYESHRPRITTLRQLARDYNSGEKKHCFVDVELCV